MGKAGSHVLLGLLEEVLTGPPKADALWVMVVSVYTMVGCTGRLLALPSCSHHPHQTVTTDNRIRSFCRQKLHSTMRLATEFDAPAGEASFHFITDIGTH